MKAGSILIFSLGALIAGWYIWSNTYVKNESFNEVVGNYDIDLSQTNLGYYARDSAKYKHLTLTFESDATFHFNMAVPFIYDSTGTWKVPVECLRIGIICIIIVIERSTHSFLECLPQIHHFVSIVLHLVRIPFRSTLFALKLKR